MESGQANCLPWILYARGIIARGYGKLYIIGRINGDRLSLGVGDLQKCSGLVAGTGIQPIGQVYSMESSDKNIAILQLHVFFQRQDWLG